MAWGAGAAACLTKLISATSIPASGGARAHGEREEREEDRERKERRGVHRERLQLARQ